MNAKRLSCAGQAESAAYQGASMQQWTYYHSSVISHFLGVVRHVHVFKHLHKVQWRK